MKKEKGFTLIELLMVVIIVAVLVSMGVPQYTKAIERSRATEAMALVKVINDALYAHAAGRNQDYNCKDITFDQLSVALPASTSAELQVRSLETEYFRYVIPPYTLPTDPNDIKTVIPGTKCKGVYARRINGGKYDYVIWNPYQVGRNKKLACFSDGDKNDSKSLCESIGLIPFKNGDGTPKWTEARLWSVGSSPVL